MSVFNKSRDRDERGHVLRVYRRPKYPTSTPGWWVNMHMNRPRRHENRRLCRQVLTGIAPDSIMWPPGSRKPHLYY